MLFVGVRYIPQVTPTPITSPKVFIYFTPLKISNRQ